MRLPSDRQNTNDLTEFLKESVKVSYDDYENSYLEALEMWNFFHNRQWSTDELATLDNRGQPKETFNVIKLFARMMLGYYSTVVNTAIAKPQQENDITNATMATDIIAAMLERNHFRTEGDKIKLSGMIAGIMCCEVVPIFTGERDQFGRPLYSMRVRHVPDYQILLDPMSTADDYEDARWLHRYKWVPEEEILKLGGQKILDKLEENYNYLEISEADFFYSHNGFSIGRYRVFDNYLLTHSVMIEDNGDRWSIYWCGDVIIEKKKITHKNVKWHYRVVRTQTSNITEFYGAFREVLESQKAINQALIKLQLMANSQKIFVEHNGGKGKTGGSGAVEDLAAFTTAVNRVTGVIPVKSLKGIKVEELTRQAMELYGIIDKAFDRIQRILGINDSFLGMAFASDSGRKVKLQQNATIMSLRYMTERIQLMYRLIGEDIVGLASQYFTAEQSLRITDEATGDRFVQLNQPMMTWTGKMDQNGEPIMQPMFEQVMNPEDGKPMEDDQGNLVFAPIPEEGTEVNFDKLDYTVESTAYNDEAEQSQLLIETVLSGGAGQLMQQVNPAGFFKISGLAIKTTRTRYSPEISRIFDETAEMLSQNPNEEMVAGAMAKGVSGQQQQRSQELKLPQEG